MSAKIAAFFGSLLFRLLLIALLLGAIAFGVTQCRNARNSGREATVEREGGVAGAATAKDAIESVGAVSGRSSDTDDLTRENADAIRSAEGADAPVHVDVRNAGLAGLCRRAAYRDSADCVQFTPAGRVAEAGAGSAAAAR